MAGDSKLVEYVYSNVLINNNTNNSVAAFYNETQDIPILSNQQDFQLRVVRLKVPMSSVPLFLYEPGKYYLGIGITDPQAPTLPICPDGVITDISGPYEVGFCPDSAPFSVPIVSTSQYINSVHNYESFLAQINITLQTAWSAIFGVAPYTDYTSTLYPAPLDADNTAPYFRLKECANCFEFVFPRGTVDSPNGTSSPWFSSETGVGLRLVMSAPLYSLLNGFTGYYFGPDGIIPTGSNTVIPELNYGLSIDVKTQDIYEYPASLSTDAPTVYFVKTQEQSSLYAWQTASRIIITTNLSVVKESVLIGENQGKPVRLEVLTDFTIPQTGIDSINEYLYYDNVDSDRWINLVDMGALRRMDLKVFVQFADLQLMPLIIYPNHEFNIKLGFRRKLKNDTYQNTSKQLGTVPALQFHPKA